MTVKTGSLPIVDETLLALLGIRTFIGVISR